MQVKRGTTSCNRLVWEAVSFLHKTWMKGLGRDWWVDSNQRIPMSTMQEYHFDRVQPNYCLMPTSTCSNPIIPMSITQEYHFERVQPNNCLMPTSTCSNPIIHISVCVWYHGMKFREIINTHIIIWIWWAEIATLDDHIITVHSRLPGTCRIHLRFFGGRIKCVSVINSKL